MYAIEIILSSTSTTSNLPDSGKLIVESTSRYVAPILTPVKSFVFGFGLNLPNLVPVTLMSLS